MAGIKIDFVSDVGKFISGTKDVSQALDKVADSLDDVAKDADRAGEEAGDNLAKGVKDGTEKVDKYAKDAGKDLADGLERGTRDAGDAGEKMERKFRSSFDAVKTDSKTTGDKVGTEIKSGFKKAESAADEFKDEAKSTSREAAASFSGDFEDVSDAIQETLANALSGFGPAGAVAGMAAAAGIGILVSVLQSSADKAAEVKEKTIELAGAIREAGGEIGDIDWAGQFEEFANAIADPKSWFEPWQAASKTNAEVIAADAEKLGLTYSDLFQGLAGDSEAAGRALEDINSKIADQREEYERLVASGMDPHVAALKTSSDALETQRDRLEQATAATEGATDLAELYTEAIEGSSAAVEDYNDAQEKRLDLIREEAELNMTAAEAEAAWAQTVMDATDALEEINKVTDTTTQATKDATDAVKDGGTELDLYTKAGQLASEALLGTAESGWKMIESAREGGASAEELAAKTQTAREEFIRQATQMGLTQEAANRLADEYGLIPSEVKTTAVFNKDDAEAAVANFTRVLGELNGKTVYTNVINRISTIETRSTSGTAAAAGMGGYNSGGQVPGAASGTYITGPGSDIDDRVPYRLSPGEFVLDKQAVDQIGVGNLQQANEGIPARATHAAPGPTAKEIGAEVAKAVAQALQGATLTLDGVDYLSNATAARINTAIARGV